MYLYFDKFGVLKENINNGAVRYGDDNSDTIYAYFEDDPVLTGVSITIQRPDETLTLTKFMPFNMIPREIPYDKNRDLKYFEDYKEYQFFEYKLTSEDLNQSGLYVATIKALKDDNIKAKGLITFNVENGVVKSSYGITDSQFDYLLREIGVVRGAYVKDVDFNQHQFILEITDQDNNKKELFLPFKDVYSKIEQLNCDMNYNNAGLLYVENYDRIKGRVRIAYNPSLVRNMVYDKATGKLRIYVKPKDFTCIDGGEERPSCEFDTIKELDIGLNEEERLQMQNNIKIEVLKQVAGGSPQVVNTESYILSLTEDKGIAVATDTGNWYYWDNDIQDRPNKYVNSGLKYQDADTILEPKDIELGTELINSSDWSLDGWTGNFTSGFKHTIGELGKLTFNFAPKPNSLYYISFDVESPTPSGNPNASTSFTLTIGNSPRFITYDGGGSKRYTFGIKAIDNTGLLFIPTQIDNPQEDGGTFDGTIKNITLKEMVGINSSSITISDAKGNIYGEERFKNNSHYVGTESGIYAIKGSELNVSFGNYSLRNNTNGYWNTAIGDETLKENTTGSRNIAIGKQSLKGNVVGDRNIGIGTFALTRNVSGRNNIGIGADSLWYNNNGNDNIAIGLASSGELRSGNGNITIGKGAFASSLDGSNNIAIGNSSMGGSTKGNDNIAIGNSTLRKNAGRLNVAIGKQALEKNTDGISNVAIGHTALASNATGANNTAIGDFAGQNIIDSNFNTFIGTASGQNSKGSSNTFIGYLAGDKMIESENIAIGNGAMSNSTEGTKNIAIGIKALNKNTGKLNVAIGYNALSNNTSGGTNVGIGTLALNQNQSGNGNLAIGNNAGQNSKSSLNTFIGNASGQTTTGGYNTFIGYGTGGTTGAGERNVIIGQSADTIANANNSIVIGDNAKATKSNQIIIGNKISAETILNGTLIVRDSDGKYKKIIFNPDGTLGWQETTI